MDKYHLGIKTAVIFPLKKLINNQPRTDPFVSVYVCLCQYNRGRHWPTFTFYLGTTRSSRSNDRRPEIRITKPGGPGLSCRACVCVACKIYPVRSVDDDDGRRTVRAPSSRGIVCLFIASKTGQTETVLRTNSLTGTHATFCFPRFCWCYYHRCLWPSFVCELLKRHLNLSLYSMWTNFVNYIGNI